MKKRSVKIFISLLAIISLAACGKASIDPTLAPIYTQVSLTVRAQLTETMPTVVPSIAATATSTPKPKPTRTPIIPTIAFATFAPTKLPSEIQASLALETLDAFDGHNLRHIAGWSDGFIGFRWMDSEHLSLHAITGWGGYVNKGESRWFVYPMVINLNSGKVWLRPTGMHTALHISSLQSLPPELAVVVLESDTGTSTAIYSLDGDLLKTYNGALMDVSPSGSKILLVSKASDANNGTETKWIDLLNNKEVVFDWQESSSGYSYSAYQPVWASDEMSVFAPTAFVSLYGNAKTGESYIVPDYLPPTDQLYVDEADYLIGAPHHSYGVWVLGDTYLLARWNEHDEGTPGYVSFFDPAKKAYRNLSAMLGLPYLLELGVNLDPPYPCQNGHPTAASGGRYIWLNCQDGGRLIDMQTFKVKKYPYYQDLTLDWSGNGNVAFLHDSYSDIPQEILFAASGEIKEIPGFKHMSCSTWHPKQNVFLYMSDNRQRLLIFDAQTMSAKQQVDLPTAMNCPIWNGRGDKVIMAAKDGSLWQIDYPALSHLEQLTEPMEGLTNWVLSSDGTSIAFVVDHDIYIVDTKRKP